MYYHAYPRDWSKTRFSARAAEHVLSYMCNVQLSKLTRNAMTGYRTEGSATQSLTSNSFCSQRTYVVYCAFIKREGYYGQVSCDNDPQAGYSYNYYSSTPNVNT